MDKQKKEETNGIVLVLLLFAILGIIYLVIV